ncbi:hypothetical protein L1049_008640 [Liquidambar formosana]|uniref:non-specific serine/threonine protein kinase n=1 Tax=Liquidambar formosana TaxID=63359 RepID=A0AAP0X9C8_LIQFO
MLGVRGRGCVFVVSCCCFMFLAVARTTSPSEVNALSAVKSSLIDPMKHLRNWNKGDPCKSNWTGVKCFDRIGNDGHLHVQELQLMNLSLSGSLAPTLGQLFYLEILDFMWNEITGSIPKEIGNISSLKLLLLNGNKLSGSLPEDLGYLSNLNRLQVDLNSISGPIPKSFASLDSLKHLHMNNNSISGQIPSELSKLSKLLHLLLDNNNLSGYLPPEFASFPDLRILQLDNNNFKGTEIPASYAYMSRLVKLSLRNCSLQGTVPDLSGIQNLRYLDLSFNQLTGSIPLNKLSDNMTTIDLSDNHLNGSIPRSFSDLPSLQRLSLENNFLIGSVPANIWSNMSFNTTTRLTLDLRNNSLSSIFGDLNPPENVTLRLGGNPICNNLNIRNIGQFCGSEAGGDGTPESSSNSTMICPIHGCPEDIFYEYVPASPVPCFCALPLRIGYRLKSPSFSYFRPYEYPFEKYLTSALSLDLHQLSIDSFVWEEGPRLRMYLKLFPVFDANHTIFNTSEIQRIRGRFTSWDFNGSDFFGPYELLNFTLLGIYSNTVSETRRESISKGILAAIIGAAACALMVSAILFLLTARNRAKFKNKLLRKNLFSKISQKIDGVKSFTFREMAVATDNFNISTQVGRGGYGRVFRGILSDNTMVAIKRAEQGSLQGQKEFLTEIELLSRLHHRNLVSLVGYCDEEGEQVR